ncbi:MAG: sulfatase-like hydrolase/transferase [Gammaproteobacteria bacterium]|nr:sulfatase-like hydrolase/transferase [Gammaproteobacteria bacterium]
MPWTPRARSSSTSRPAPRTRRCNRRQTWLNATAASSTRGWDRLREETFARQQAAGVIPRDAVLTPRPDALPAWDSLTPEEQRVSARLMELYAAFLAHTDAQVGRLRDALKDMDQYDNTLFVYIVGDNGASAEGGLKGSSNYMGDLQGLVSEVARYADAPQTLSGENTYAHYNAGWAWGTNTPFQWTGQVASHRRYAQPDGAGVARAHPRPRRSARSSAM